MNLDFKQILKRTGLFFGEMPPIKSGMVAVLAAKLAANGQTGLHCVATVCQRMTFTYLRGWIAQKSVKLSPTKSNQIKPNQTKKVDWTVPAWFKTNMEVCNP